MKKAKWGLKSPKVDAAPVNPSGPPSFLSLEVNVTRSVTELSMIGLKNQSAHQNKNLISQKVEESKVGFKVT